MECSNGELLKVTQQVCSRTGSWTLEAPLESSICKLSSIPTITKPFKSGLHAHHPQGNKVISLLLKTRSTFRPFRGSSKVLEISIQTGCSSENIKDRLLTVSNIRSAHSAMGFGIIISCIDIKKLMQIFFLVMLPGLGPGCNRSCLPL